MIVQTELMSINFPVQILFLAFPHCSKKTTLYNDSWHLCRASLRLPAKDMSLANYEKLISRHTINKMPYMKYEVNRVAVIQKLLPLLTNANLQREVSREPGENWLVYFQRKWSSTTLTCSLFFSNSCIQFY